MDKSKNKTILIAVMVIIIIIAFFYFIKSADNSTNIHRTCGGTSPSQYFCYSKTGQGEGWCSSDLEANCGPPSRNCGKNSFLCALKNPAHLYGVCMPNTTKGVNDCIKQGGQPI